MLLSDLLLLCYTTGTDCIPLKNLAIRFIAVSKDSCRLLVKEDIGLTKVLFTDC